MMVDKPGILYSDMRDNVRTYDLLLFRGADFVSNTISHIETVMDGSGDFTHAGIAIRAKDLPESSQLYRPPQDDKLYVFESTASGKIAGGPPGTDGRGHLGVQVRDMDTLVPIYDGYPSSRLAWLPLREDTRPPINPYQVQDILDRYTNLMYDANCLDLLASAFPVLRSMRRIFRNSCCLLKYMCCMCFTARRTGRWYFCSELVSQIYIDIGVFPDSLNPEDVLPMDFMPRERNLTADDASPPKDGATLDADKQVPWVFRKVIPFKFR